MTTWLCDAYASRQRATSKTQMDGSVEVPRPLDTDRTSDQELQEMVLKDVQIRFS
jgi:hypothetical protein